MWDEALRHIPGPWTHGECGCDLLLCPTDPYKMRHGDVRKSIGRMGEHVLPEFEE